ncbi:type II toxin-antitoxin system VapC family toxin [Rhodoferax sp.]|uniref:type II toxin-antitoxin system VapC family toxin n=1 Tax=Rhodoferax sp. TaxID=50421 RepID=UPI0008C0E066|nr:PIN domain-containing protein [Rhodoferax sp.]MDO8320967.1 PIN domain-containing protein [Rhodoferax sp.]OGB82631.1 MAG: twitching motility protein PilT [Burkholderiales bacterium RIFOXYC12_FULL_60_6]
MNVLVDSSVWVGHFKQRNEHLVALLEADLVVCHPFIVAEVACGTPPSRKVIINMLSELERVPVAKQDELLAMLDARQLYGRGCGFVDLSLLASALLSEKTLIWTLDKRFELLAAQANRAFSPKLHS